MEMPEEEDSMKTQLGKMATELRELRTWIGTFEDSRKGLQATLATVMDRHHWDRHNLAVARAKTQEMEVSHSMMIFNLSLAESSTQLYKTQLAEAKQVIEKLRTELKVTQEHNLSLRDNVYVLENLMNDHTPDRTPF
jgi:chromosome segregation ATPase